MVDKNKDFEDMSFEEFEDDDISLDDLEQMVEETDSDIEDFEYDDISEDGNKRVQSKLYEALSEKERARKEKEMEERIKAKRRATNGFVTLMITVAMAFGTFVVFEEPIMDVVGGITSGLKMRLGSTFNKDITEKIDETTPNVVKDIVGKGSGEDESSLQDESSTEESQPDVVESTPDTDIDTDTAADIDADKLAGYLSSYNGGYPLVYDPAVTKVADITITDGNYIVGVHIPAATYFIQVPSKGFLDFYANDLALSINEISKTTEIHGQNFVTLKDGQVVKLSGEAEMFPNEYRKDFEVWKVKDIVEGGIYQVGVDIPADTEVKLMNADPDNAKFKYTITKNGEKLSDVTASKQQYRHFDKDTFISFENVKIEY